MKVPRRHARKGRIEIIPMIDAIFFLLVFFMFSSLSMVKMKAMALSVPRPSRQPVAAERAGSYEPGEKVVLSVDAAGKYSLSGAAIAPSRLMPELQARIDAHPESLVIINIDKGQTAQHLIDVMDAVNKVAWPPGRAPRVLIATEPVDSKGMPAAPRGEVY